MSNELVTKENFNLVSFTEDAMQNLNGIQLQCPQLKIPSGGNVYFDIDEEPYKELIGVIVDHGPMNVYFAGDFDGSSQPPDCFSKDGINGMRRIDNGAGDDIAYEPVLCEGCPYAEFGSGKNGGKACKEKHQLFIQLSGEMLPYSLLLPVSSTGVLNAYATKLFTKGIFLNDVLTSFTLEKAQNKTNIVYSKIVMKAIRPLTPEEKEKALKTREFVRSING